ncbi:MAG: peptidoglycan bridge formation protein FemAB, partial [Candidatus Omnitrophica bacterium]|nr:peptidoglycan bridge formation protein FemAB [Candidatus Omnitrophota bacterium]
MTIKLSDGTGWDDYVFRHPHSFFYHLYRWGECLEEVFGFKKYYLAAEESGNIRGILPLVLVRTMFGSRLISVPIGVYAGPLADDPATVDKLTDEAASLAKRLGCDYLELRSMKDLVCRLLLEKIYVTFIKPLPETKEECLE